MPHQTHLDDEHDAGGSIAADVMTTRNAYSQAILTTKSDRKADREHNGDHPHHQRRLQAAVGDSRGMSLDTVAIVITVLIGAAG